MKTADWPFNLDRLKPTTTRRVVFDLETCLIAPGVQAPNVVAMGFSVDGGPVKLISANTEAFDRAVESLFLNPSVLLVGHNVAFDLTVLLAHGAKFGLKHWPAMIFAAVHQDRVTCTQLREKLLHIARGNRKEFGRLFNLGACAQYYDLAVKPNKEDPWRLRWGTLGETPVSEYPAEAAHYLIEDIQSTELLYVAQARLGNWLQDEYRQARAALALTLISAWGIRPDHVAARKLLALVTEDIAILTTQLQAAGLVRPDGSRDLKAAAARMEAACAALGRPTPRNEVTELQEALEQPGNVTLDEEACRNSKDPILVAYSRLSQRTLLQSKVARTIRPVIQARFEVLQDTGRTSCSQGRDPKVGEAPIAFGSQIQNPPREVRVLCRACQGAGCEAEGCINGECIVSGVREIFAARPGTVLLDIDSSIMELRCLAQIERWDFGASDLGDVLNDPKRDPHIEIGAAAVGHPPEYVYELKKRDKAKFDDIRQLGKAISFGTPGGMGYRNFVDFAQASYGITITEDRAKEIIATTRKIYRQRGPYLEKFKRLSNSGPHGFSYRHHFSGRVRGGLNFTNGANNPFQGLAADAAKISLWRVVVSCFVLEDSPLYGCRPVNFIHDQCLLESPEVGFRPAAKELQKQWVGGAQEVIPDILILAEPAACRKWSKSGGDAKYGPDGELLVYEDA